MNRIEAAFEKVEQKEAKFFADIGAGWLTGFDDISILEKKTSLHIIKNIEVMPLEENVIRSFLGNSAGRH